MRRGPPPSRLVLVPALGLLGAVVGWFGDGDPVAASVLLLEPLLWVLVSWMVFGALTRGERLLAFGLACGGLTAAACARVSRPAAEEGGIDAAPFAERTRTCARELPLPASSFTLLHWTVDDAPPTIVATIAEVLPDVVVLRGALAPSLAADLDVALGGESISLPGVRDAHVFTRGAIDLCGKADHWTDAPAPGVTMGLVFVSVDGATRFPLVVGELPEVWSTDDWRRSVRNGRAALRTTADALASSLLVVALEAPYALGAPRLSATLRAAQLWPVARGLDWPSRPFGLHSFTPVWAGEGWRSGATRAVRHGGVGRSGTLVPIAPRWQGPE